MLGVKLVTFERPKDDNWNAALDAQCFLISERINEIGVQHKLTPDAREAQANALSFCHGVEGAWWQRSNIIDDDSAVSFFDIKPDMRFNSVRLKGNAYDKNGVHSSYWKSVIARINSEENKIIYVWKGRHKKPKVANIPFHGLGEMEFDRPLEAGKIANSGNGRFWRVDEFNPAKTILKTNELRRVSELSEIETMASGRRDEVRSLVMKIMNDF